MDRRKGAVLRSLHVTEKAGVLQELVDSESNPCVAKCKTAKYVFIVDPRSNKCEIKAAVEEAFKEKNVKVLKVNTIVLPSKEKRARGTAKMGKTAQIKKAVVTLREGDRLDFEM